MPTNDQPLILPGSPTTGGRQLYWLAEPAAPMGDPADQHDVFVTIGDQVALSRAVETTALIVGTDGIRPVVRYLSGHQAGQVATVDPDDIVAAVTILKGMGLR